MFFGRGADAKECNISDLIPCLNEQFSRKVSRIDSRCTRIISGINSSKDALLSACDDFAQLSEEPDIEFRRITSTTYVKDLKTAYVTALKRTLQSSSGGTQHPTQYHLYEAELAAADALINEVLRTNKKFKLVLDGYAKHLDKFKRAFSSIEAHTSELRLQIAAHSIDRDHYNELQAHIARITALAEEQSALGKKIRELENPGQEGAGGLADNPAKDSISQKRAEIGSIAEEIAHIGSETSVLLSIIEKAARKHDYSSLSKKKLSSFIENRSLISTDYEAFLSEIGSLKKELEGGTIDIKNRDEVLRAANAIANGRIAEQMERQKILEGKKAAVEAELRGLERIEREISELESSKKNRQATLERARAEMKEAAENVRTEKATVERLFLEFFKKQITVVA